MNYKSVTLWHRNNDDTYKREFFERAYIRKIRKNDQNASSVTKNNSMIIRIFTLAKFDIDVGDRICEGYDEAVIPPRDSYIVSEIRENMDVSACIRHYRLECN